ncbi:uncharacterized protein [Haliotis cracherodii]|uniref:uncharacterized protein n=1 Tax=Haliotis cracherodii TaxID=6455 RepID=UPI0039ED2EE9
MAANILLPLWILLSCIIGALAETCYGAYESITCIFGCCEDSLYVYCCLSNGAGIGIICACLTVVLSVIGACCRRAYANNNRRPHTVIQTVGAPSVAVVGSTQNQYGFSNQQMVSQFDPPAYPGPASTPPYPGPPPAYSNKV